MERTLALIKPRTAQDSKAVASILDVLCTLFFVREVKVFQFTKATAAEFYKEHEGRSYYSRLVEFMSSAPCFAIILEGEGVIREYRRLMGNTDPSKAEYYTLRGCWGTGIPDNAVHGSDSETSANREIRLVFREYYEN